MSVFQRGGTWWYKFTFAGKLVRESAKTTSKTLAREIEKERRRELEEGHGGVSKKREERVRSIDEIAVEYVEQYKVRHPGHSGTFADHCLRHVRRHLGSKMVVQISADTVTQYQVKRLKEQAAPKSINEETGFLLRIIGDRGEFIRGELRKTKQLKLRVPFSPGKAFDVQEKDRMLAAAAKSASPLILPALTLALNAGLRDAEIKTLRWSQIDFAKLILTVGKGKTEGGEGRTIPLNSEILSALQKHAAWYAKKFGELKPERYVFPSREKRSSRMNPAKPVVSLKTAWKTVRKDAGVKGRWHDNRHTLITELAESGAGDETIMAIAGHVSRAMLTRYSHIRTQAKRTALEDVVARRQQERVRLKEAAEKEAADAAAVTVN